MSALYASNYLPNSSPGPLTEIHYQLSSNYTYTLCINTNYYVILPKTREGNSLDKLINSRPLAYPNDISYALQ